MNRIEYDIIKIFRDIINDLFTIDGKEFAIEGNNGTLEIFPESYCTVTLLSSRHIAEIFSYFKNQDIDKLKEISIINVVFLLSFNFYRDNAYYNALKFSTLLHSETINEQLRSSNVGLQKLSALKNIFDYENGKQALKGYNLTIEANKVVSFESYINWIEKFNLKTKIDSQENDYEFTINYLRG